MTIRGVSTKRSFGVRYILGIAGCLLAVLIVCSTVPRAYADDLTCQTLNTGCTAKAPTLSPSDGYHQLAGLFFNWTDDQDTNNAITFRVCVSRSGDMVTPVCETTTQLTIAATDLMAGTSSDGTWYWQVTALAGGLLGNDGASAVQAVVVDTPPTVSLLVNQSTTPADVGNGATVAIHGVATDTPVSNCHITIAGASGAVAGPFDCVSVTDFQWSTAGLVSDSYMVTITASDATMDAAQVTPVSTSISMLVDNDGPQVTLGNDGVLSQTSIQPDLTATDTHGPITYAWSNDVTNPQSLTYQTDIANPTFTPTLNGDYVFNVVATDAFGNATTKKFHFSYWADIPIVTGSTDPTNPVTDITPATSSVPDATTEVVTPTATTRRGDDENNTPAAASTLGVTTAAIAKVVGGDSKDTSAAIIATHQGWRILGILWYWWVIIIALLLVAYSVARRKFSGRNNKLMQG